jgi:hypothetical protein
LNKVKANPEMEPEQVPTFPNQELAQNCLSATMEVEEDELGVPLGLVPALAWRQFNSLSFLDYTILIARRLNATTRQNTRG